MATSVSGPLRIVTDRAPDGVQVRVSAPKVRPHAGGVVVSAQDVAEVSGGVVSFTAVPGPAILSVVWGGVPVESVPLIIPDTASASLETCMRAAGLVDEATKRELEELAARVAAGVELATGAIDQVRESADAAEVSRQAAATSAADAAEARRIIDGYRESVVSVADAAGRDRVAAEAARVGAESAQADAVAQAKAAAGSATSAKSDADRAGTSAAAADSSAKAASGSASTAKSEADRARQAADSAAETVASGSPDATTTTKGKVRLAGDLAGTADAPTVPALAGKADKTHTHTIAQVTGLDTALSGKATTSHTHTTAQVEGLDAALSKKIETSQATPLAMGGMVAQRTTAGTMQAADPSAAADVATKNYVDGLLVVGNTAATDGKLHLVYE